jgi:hypothetical protein
MHLSRRDVLAAIPAGAALSAALPLGAAPAGPRLGCQTNARALPLPGHSSMSLNVLGTLTPLPFEGFQTSCAYGFR